MPWIGVLDGERVIPEAVDDGCKVTCPDCGNSMHPRGPMSDGRARHFWHTSNIGSGGTSTCGGGEGESDIHRRYKNHAVSRLRELYDRQYRRAQPEVRLGVDVELPSGADERQADALVEFTEPSDKLGYGVIIEVQYRNEDKDIEAVERDYLHLGYSVIWTEEGDFTDDRCLLDYEDVIDRVVPVWPTAVPEYEEWRPGHVEGLDLEDFRILTNWDSRASYGSEFISDASVLDSYWRANIAFGGPEQQFEAPVLEATLPTDWIDAVTQRIWRDQGWFSLFSNPRTDEYYLQELRSEIESDRNSPMVEKEIPFHKFLTEDITDQTAQYRQQLHSGWEHGTKLREIAESGKDRLKVTDRGIERPAGKVIRCRCRASFFTVSDYHTHVKGVHNGSAPGYELESASGT